MFRFSSAGNSSRKHRGNQFSQLPEELQTGEFGREIGKHKSRSQLFFLIGLSLAILMVQSAFRWQGPQSRPLLEASGDLILHVEETIPRTRIKRPVIQAPPPPQGAKATVIDFGEVRVTEDYLFKTQGKAELPDPDAEIWSTGEEIEIEETLLDPVFENPDRMPVYPGGMSAFNRYLQEHIDYTALAIELGTQGTIEAEFVVEKDGSISGIIIKGRKLGHGLEKQVREALANSPRWAPGVKHGLPVRVAYSKSVTFVLGG